jgi:hypothetical protein
MITISFSFAWFFFTTMIAGIVLILYGILFRKNASAGAIALGVLLLFGADFFCVGGSLIYRSHPVNGDIVGQIPYRWCGKPDGIDHCNDGVTYGSGGTWYGDGCATFNWSTGKRDPMVACIAPTPEDNPYEQQPLHPIAWIAGGIKTIIDAVVQFVTGAIQIKVQP